MELDLYNREEEKYPFLQPTRPQPQLQQPVPPSATPAPVPAQLPIMPTQGPLTRPPGADPNLAFASGGDVSRGIPPGGMQPIQAMEPQEEQFGDIEELRAEPWDTKFEQAALARADELVNERYNSQRQQKAMELARRNITPESPLYMREMRGIDEGQAKELANFRRNLQLEKIDKRQRNLAQARQLEVLIDNMERQRYADLLGALSGNPDFMSRGSDIAGQLAALSSQQGARASAGAAQSFASAGDLFGQLLAGQQQRQPTTINLPAAAGLTPLTPPPPPNAGTYNPPPGWGAGEEWMWNP